MDDDFLLIFIIWLIFLCIEPFGAIIIALLFLMFKDK